MIGERTKREIDKVVNGVLREAGLREPPVRVEHLLKHLELHREFYSLQDPSLLQRFMHKVNVEGHKLAGIAKKIRLAAVWLPDEERILVDQDLPKPKKEWATFHDTTHSILEWHRPYFLGDTAQTLKPDYQDMLEAEANYGASALMFGGKAFAREALDTKPCWASVEALRKLHDKSFETTLRRYVEHSHDVPMAMMISTPWWKETPEDQVGRIRHFVGSRRFKQEFGGRCRKRLLEELLANTPHLRGGPAGEFALCLTDRNGARREFYAESFFNHYNLLTLIVYQQAMTNRRLVMPSSAIS